MIITKSTLEVVSNYCNNPIIQKKISVFNSVANKYLFQENTSIIIYCFILREIRLNKFIFGFNITYKYCQHIILKHTYIVWQWMIYVNYSWENFSKNKIINLMYACPPNIFYTIKAKTLFKSMRIQSKDIRNYVSSIPKRHSA